MSLNYIKTQETIVYKIQTQFLNILKKQYFTNTFSRVIYFTDKCVVYYLVK